MFIYPNDDKSTSKITGVLFLLLINFNVYGACPTGSFHWFNINFNQADINHSNTTHRDKATGIYGYGNVPAPTLSILGVDRVNFFGAKPPNYTQCSSGTNYCEIETGAIVRYHEIPPNTVTNAVNALPPGTNPYIEYWGLYNGNTCSPEQDPQVLINKTDITQLQNQSASQQTQIDYYADSIEGNTLSLSQLSSRTDQAEQDINGIATSLSGLTTSQQNTELNTITIANNTAQANSELSSANYHLQDIASKLLSTQAISTDLQIKADERNQKLEDIRLLNETFNTKMTGIENNTSGQLQATNIAVQKLESILSNAQANNIKTDNLATLQSQANTIFAGIASDIDKSNKGYRYDNNGVLSSWRPTTAILSGINEYNTRRIQQQTDQLESLQLTNNDVNWQQLDRLNQIISFNQELNTLTTETNSILENERLQQEQFILDLTALIENIKSDTTTSNTNEEQQITELQNATQQLTNIYNNAQTTNNQLNQMNQTGDLSLSELQQIKQLQQQIKDYNQQANDIFTEISTEIKSSNQGYYYNNDGSFDNTTYNTAQIDALNERNTRQIKTLAEQRNELLAQLNQKETIGSTPQDFDQYTNETYTQSPQQTNPELQEEYDTGVTLFGDKLNELTQTKNDLLSVLDEDQTTQLQTQRNALINYFKPTFTYSNLGCHLATLPPINFLGGVHNPNPIELSFCEYMDTFRLIGNILFVFANLSAIFIFLRIFTSG